MKRLLLVGMMFAAMAAASQFKVTMDTSALSGQTGTIDIQFNPGTFPGPYNLGTATITNFLLTGGTIGSIAAGPDGGAVGGGGLPGPLAIANSDFLNGILYNAIFGTQASFLADFTGDAFTAASPSILSTLSVTLTGTSAGPQAIVDLIGDRHVDASASTADVSVSEVPEPATYGLLSLGLGALVFAARRRSR